MAKHQTFRAGVGIIVKNDEGDVLALQRAGQPGAWQLPQGGLAVGEEPLQAALRELREETGLHTEQVELMAEHPLWLAYELPAKVRSKKTGRGQVHKWFLFRLKDPSCAIDEIRSDELDSARWMSLPALAAATWEVRRPVYRQLAEHFAGSLRPA